MLDANRRPVLKLLQQGFSFLPDPAPVQGQDQIPHPQLSSPCRNSVDSHSNDRILGFQIRCQSSTSGPTPKNRRRLAFRLAAI